ncbi:MAG: chemotaxis protein CheW [Parvibaculum sp.]|uniref:hybrid sensor histidine kinase/response regulator n=1 Tax=Parvibaculum sp. TaxID=2024848 RepID=UPI0025D01930|nr:chemotaxis protein CheW [Parvibaculum sp.]MCE9648514.1 chemotaxis protein CheW [Parvibaculum sp.]
MDDLLKEFLAETSEALEMLDSELVELEQRPGDPQLLGSIFRIMHTIKGTCGFLGLPRLETVAHAAEDVLGKIRDGELQVSPEAVSLVLAALDRIKELIEALATLGEEPKGSDDEVINDLRLMASGQMPAATVVEEEAEEAVVAEAPLEGLYQRVGGAAVFDTAAEQACTELMAATSAHPDAEAEMLSLQFALAGAFTSALSGKDGATDDIDGVITGLVANGWSAGELQLLREEFGKALGTLEVAEADVSAVLSRFKLDEPKAAAPKPIAPKAEAPKTEAPKAAPKAAAPKPAKTESADADHPSAAAAAQSQTLRVNINVLENLMNMVSELVLTRNQLLQTLRSVSDSPFSAPLQRLNQVTTELQESVMQTRMQPIGNAWSKLPRLVRDLTQELCKKIELVMTGADTELDRQILESIKDPLTHMVRNSADHGLEEPEDRRAAGKPECGSITLSARHEGGHILVEVADDGRGLPTSRIRAKVIQNGLATEAQLDGMTEQQIQQFIFRPGFSTASAVTSVSGRGVGMDVVRTNIEKIGGVIEFSSTEGQGSRFVIKIPLTLAIVSALIVECGGERFAMPQSSVIELVRISRNSPQGVEMINGHPVYRLRDRLLPLVALNELLGLDRKIEAEGEGGELYVVVAQVGSFVFGIIVDRVFDTEEIVVKPASRTLRHISLFSGTTILGDGSVIMILDPNGISAATSGANHEAQAKESVQVSQRGRHETVSMLVFRAGGEGNKAVPLSLIARLEEADLSTAEQAGDRTVLQYRGGLMPLVNFDGAPAARTGKHPILVFAEGERMCGLVVDEVVDIVEGSLDLQLVSGGAEAGLLGSSIIAGKSTDVIDTVHYLRQSDAAWFELQTHEPFGVQSERRVLLVEDSSFFRNLLMPMLKMAGYRVTIAEHGEAALGICRDGEEFDIIVSDIEMPGLSGFDLARTLKSDERWKDVPMVALSSHANPQDFERGKNAGFTDYVTKLDPKALLTSLSRVLAEDATEREDAA